MQKIKQNIFPLCFILSIPLIGMFYGAINNPGSGAHSLVTGVDRSIPLLKIFVIPYIFWYIFPIIVLSYLCIKDKTTYYKTLISYDIGLLICYAIYFLYQTTVPRPILSGNDIFTKLLSYVYSSDRPYNCFPSIHSLTSYLMIKAINKSSIRNVINSLLIKGTSSLIILSTLFIKQHVILDAMAAVVLGDTIFRLVCMADYKIFIMWIKSLYPQLNIKRRAEI